MVESTKRREGSLASPQGTPGKGEQERGEGERQKRKRKTRKKSKKAPASSLGRSPTWKQSKKISKTRTVGDVGGKEESMERGRRGSIQSNENFVRKETDIFEDEGKFCAVVCESDGRKEGTRVAGEQYEEFE